MPHTRRTQQRGLLTAQRGAARGRDYRLRHKDGSYRWILTQSAIVLGDDGLPERMLGSQIDITERLRLEERLREAEKLEAIGTLAAGIAHDFNNLLGAITGNLSMLRETAADDPDVPSTHKELEEAAKRAAGLTYRLLTFEKGGTPVRTATSIRELIVEWAQFVTRGSNCRCEFRVAGDLDTVEIDIGQLNQVMNNLLINAMQAMPQGGTIEVLQRLKAVDPAVVGVVTSGYTEDDVLVQYEHHGFRGRLRKPVGMSALSAEMARVLS